MIANLIFLIFDFIPRIETRATTRDCPYGTFF